MSEIKKIVPAISYAANNKKYRMNAIILSENKFYRFEIDEICLSFQRNANWQNYKHAKLQII
jgi:hypothetical protein